MSCNTAPASSISVERAEDHNLKISSNVVLCFILLLSIILLMISYTRYFESIIELSYHQEKKQVNEQRI